MWGHALDVSEYFIENVNFVFSETIVNFRRN